MKEILKVRYREDKFMDELVVHWPVFGAGKKLFILHDILSNPAPDPFPVAELDKDSWETLAINAAGRHFNDLRGSLGLAAHRFPCERLHILDAKTFEEHVNEDGRTAGTCQNGHIYIVRHGDRVRFLCDLTHEMAHLHAFSRMRLSFADEAARLVSLRHGLHVYRYRGKEGAGLDEAVTEIIGHIIRERMRREGIGLRAEEAGALSRSWSYLPQIEIVDAVIDALDRPREKIINMIFQDYFSGTNRFFSALYRLKPGAAAILRRMGVTTDDALATARELGIPGLAEHIENLIARKKELTS